MIVIIKHFPNQLSPIFCAGDIACEKAGELANIAIEKMKSNNLLHEMDPVKVIDKYFRHAELISDAKSCTYYELKKHAANSAYDLHPNPIIPENILCNKCSTPIVAKNKQTNKDVCPNPNCINYNEDVIKRLKYIDRYID